MPKKKTQRRRSRLGALGLPPDEHRTREGTFSTQAAQQADAMNSALKEGKCRVAFARLIDLVSYAGMAEAENVGHGGDGTAHSGKAAEALKSFRAKCSIGE